MCINDDELKASVRIVRMPPAHMDSDHPQDDESARCDLCVEAFSSRTALIAHINSVKHLHRAKKQLEAQGSVDLSSQVRGYPGLDSS
ncbi:unnamed protein product [Nippostrongylus brasiliensis]|uniref:C2H2-type domain-containing protein n=1 Tax=Nippostrongylus brasiliensis TaxID=27835 RepID=A0A0N4YKF4_NIPBR|nr:unnamed protein product [Nippostrongylus brasiliensis]